MCLPGQSCKLLPCRTHGRRFIEPGSLTFEHLIGADHECIGTKLRNLDRFQFSEDFGTSKRRLALSTHRCLDRLFIDVRRYGVKCKASSRQ